MIILPKNSILQWMQQQERELTLIRHRLHHEPELGHAEYKTTHLIRERLEAYGAELLPCRCDTGVVALVHGAADGPLLALRGYRRAANHRKYSAAFRLRQRRRLTRLRT